MQVIGVMLPEQGSRKEVLFPFIWFSFSIFCLLFAELNRKLAGVRVLGHVVCRVPAEETLEYRL